MKETGYVCIILLLLCGAVTLADANDTPGFNKHILLNDYFTLDVAANDFTGDGVADLAVLTADSEIHVYKSLGNGMFAEPIVSQCARPHPMHVHDFNNDSHMDILIGDFIYFGNGDGTFGDGMSHCLFKYEDGINVYKFADINNDNIIDALFFWQTGYYVEIGIQLGSGNGGFSEKQQLIYTDKRNAFITFDKNNDDYTSISSVLSYPVLKDINNDGNLDILSILQESYVEETEEGKQLLKDIRIITWFGDDKGSFNDQTSRIESIVQEQTLFYDSCKTYESAIVLCDDIDGDGITDIVIEGREPNCLLFMKGDSTGQFYHEKDISDSSLPQHQFKAIPLELNHDENVDFLIFGTTFGEYHCPEGQICLTVMPETVENRIVISQYDPYSYEVLPADLIQELSIADLDVGDFNNDGYDDFVIGFEEATIFFNNGSPLSITDDKQPAGNIKISNAPNPFNASTTIQYSIGAEGHISGDIYNINGQIVKTLVDSHHEPGVYSLQWNGFTDTGIQCSSGLYFCHIKHENGITDNIKLLYVQ